MSKSAIFFALLLAALTVSLFSIVNEPREEPAWPTRVQGFSFSPMREGNDPRVHNYPTIEQIDEDLALLAGKAHAIRTYSVHDVLGAIPRLAQRHGLNVTVGAWIDHNRDNNEKELAGAIRIARDNFKNVVRVMVGNEVLHRGEMQPQELYAYLDRAREALDVPVSTAEPWYVWLEKYPELADHVDVITVHLLPYWEGKRIDEAVAYALERYDQVVARFPNKKVIVGEVGWPSNGPAYQASFPSVANQASFLRRFLAEAEKRRITYYVIEAFDQRWKDTLEGAAGSYWGVYDVKRVPKFPFTEPLVRVPEWRELAAISIAVSLVLFALLMRDGGGLRSRGRGFLALIAYGTAVLAVGLVYHYTRQYMTAATAGIGIMLFLAMLGVIVVLLAEAHEWAEALWLTRFRRVPQPVEVADETLPKVSIHVPAYNEPPDMLIETLNGLAALDYPDFEVLVIDNNTKDPRVWEPVKEHCEKLGERFRFFHVSPLAGFKAGACNFAMRNTAPDAEVIAVIDSDYIVHPRWLRDLVPQFRDEKIAIVQAPQDYRDGGENAFKAMCLAEYRGFFHIGMVTRNERDAIIQHGTMTMVRRRVLEEVGGWSEWCITEDAELGLRIFEKGYSATYIPMSYGRGLMPDTFIDFKKQRFRWAYGAVLIMRQHLAQILGLKASSLTTGQRYHFVAGWLPWFADGFNLVFNMAALAWSAAMVYAPREFSAPLATVAIFPLALFGFKVLKMFFLYRRRVSATWRQSIAAALAGLALSHTIALAMLTGFVTRGIGFFRTPKMATANSLVKAFVDAREETLMLIALLVAGLGVLLSHDFKSLDVKVWVALLVVQGIPYAAALLVSLVSALPGLPARLVGPMGEMAREPVAVP